MFSESWLLTSPPTVTGTFMALPLRASSWTRLVAASLFDVNCRRAIDEVTARVGLNATHTVQVPAGTAGVAPLAGAPGASGPPVMQVLLVMVKSCADAVSGALAWTWTLLMVSGASPVFSTVTGTGAPVLPPSTASNCGGVAYRAGAAAPRTASKLLRAVWSASKPAVFGGSSS